MPSPAAVNKMGLQRGISCPPSGDGIRNCPMTLPWLQQPRMGGHLHSRQV